MNGMTTNPLTATRRTVARRSCRSCSPTAPVGTTLQLTGAVLGLQQKENKRILRLTYVAEHRIVV